MSGILQINLDNRKIYLNLSSVKIDLEVLMRLAFALFLAALAVPPSTTLSGPEGVLQWTVSPTANGVTIDGRSPKWEVHHTATSTLTPLGTTRRDADGVTVTVAYTAAGATVTLPNKTVEIDEPNLWDGDTLDVRLGALVAAGQADVDFRALDVATGKVYSFGARTQGRETCGDLPCTHVRVTLTGLLKAIGPKWHYHFGDDGRLLRFDGPIGTYTAEG
jgi:hypothetical protein